MRDEIRNRDVYGAKKLGHMTRGWEWELFKGGRICGDEGGGCESGCGCVDMVQGV